MDTAYWHQGLGLMMPMEETLMGATANKVQRSSPNLPVQTPYSGPGGTLRGGAPAVPGSGVGVGAGAGSTERRSRPQKEKGINCPRCNSTNTKFCYYNNYSLQQPRYFCKTCRRYWTEGGSLRNVPVGGGSRKNKRSSSLSSSPATTSTNTTITSTSMATPAGAVGGASKNPKLAGHEGAQDLNLAFPPYGGLQAQADYMAFPSMETNSMCNPFRSMANNGRAGGGVPGPAAGALSAMELLRSTGCYMPLQLPMHILGEYAAAGSSLGEFGAPPPATTQSQSLLGFSMDAHGPVVSGACATGYSSTAGLQERASRRLLFPFRDLKSTGSPGGGDESGGGGSVDAIHQFEQGKEQDSGTSGGQHDTPVFWNSMIGGGTSW